MKHWLQAFRLRTLPLAMCSIIVGSALVLFCGCGADPAGAVEDRNYTQVKEQAAIPDTSSSVAPSGDTDGQLNLTDAKGRKQGHWVTTYRAKPWKDEYYKNGLRDGLCKEYIANGEVYEANYVNGVRNGLCMQYDPDSATAMFQELYENDTVVYMVFPWDLASFIVPVKGWLAWRDSVEFDVRYLTGKLMYHGYLNRTEGKKIKDAPYGEHRAYYEDGSLKAIINYDTDSMVVYSRKGEVIKRTTPREWQGTQLR